MYNAMLKQEFLSTVKRSGNYKIFFNSFSKYEEELGKDLHMMTREEIATGLGKMGYVTYAVVENVLSMVRKYLLWYADNNKGTIGLEIFKINWNDVDISDSMRTKMVTSEDEIINEFDSFKPEDGHFVQIIYMFAFHGVPPTVLCSLKDDDVVCNGDLVVLNTRHSINQIRSEKLVDITMKYKSWQSDMVDSQMGARFVRRDDCGMFLYRRMIEAYDSEEKPVDVPYITQRIYQIKKKLKNNIEFKFDIGEVRLSGQYLRMCQYYNMFGKWPDKYIMNDILGKKCRDGFDRDRMIRGAELYKDIFNV